MLLQPFSRRRSISSGVRKNEHVRTDYASISRQYLSKVTFLLLSLFLQKKLLEPTGRSVDAVFSLA